MLAGSAALAGAAAWVSGCSVLYDLSTTQCTVDADCAGFDRAEPLVCDVGLGICKAQEFECRTNQDCIDSQEFFGSAAACIQNECAALQTAECPMILPQIDDAYIDNLTADNPLILGAFGGTAMYGNSAKNFDLALTQFTQAGVGRPLVMVVCNAEPADDEELDRAMTHLADTLQVPGVVSTLQSSHLQRAVEGKGLERNMFFISAFDSDSTLIRIQDRGLLWHMLAGGEAIAQSYAPVVARALDYIPEPTEPVRIAQVITTDNRFLQDSSSVVFDTVRFNDKSVGENLVDENYLPVNVTSTASSYATQIAALRAFKPHIVLATTMVEFPATIAPQIEQNWDMDAAGQARPFYILSPWVYGSGQAANFASNADIRSRVIGLNAPAASNPTLFVKYLSDWLATFGENGMATENIYDATYFLLYSALAAGERLQTGDDLLRGMGRLISPSGQPFNVGFDHLADAAFLLNTTNANISLTGTLGPPNFDNNGGRADSGTVWCYNSAGLLQSDVMTYNKESGEMDGSLDACFPGF